MAESKGFDLSALIGSVPELGTERQQITYIPIEKILPNGDNFYSLDGLDELVLLENYLPRDRLGDQKKLNDGGE